MILHTNGDVLRSLRERLMIEVLYKGIGRRPHPPRIWIFISAIAGGTAAMANVMMMKAIMDDQIASGD